MSERQAFLDAIAANPRDIVTRKVFADWLDEHDEPEAADVQRKWTVEKQDGIEYLERLAQEHGIGTGDIRDMVREQHVGPHESLRDDIYSDREEFFRHYQNAFGVEMTPDEVENIYFTCGC